MRHGYYGKKLSRTKNERRRLLQGLARELIKREKITTTRAKASAVQPLVEKLITKAKAGGEAKRRDVFATLADKASTQKLFAEASSRFSKRTSGFTRVIRLGNRSGDNSAMVRLSFVDEPVADAALPPTVLKAPKKSVVKKRGRSTATRKQSNKVKK